MPGLARRNSAPYALAGVGPHGHLFGDDPLDDPAGRALPGTLPRAATAGKPRPYTVGYFDPSYDYAVGHERAATGHPHDVVDPYLRAHERDFRRAAARGDFHATDPALLESQRTLVADEPVVPAVERTRGTARGTNVTHRYSSYVAPAAAAPATIKTAAPVAVTTTTRELTPPPAHRRSLSTGAGYPVALPGGARLVHTVPEAGEDVWYYPSGRARSPARPAPGALVSEQYGVSLPLAARQAVPYGTAIRRTGTGATTVVAPGYHRDTFHAESSVFRRAPVTPSAGRTAYTAAGAPAAAGTAYATTGTHLPPRTTVTALDRANMIALREEEASRPVSYTKIGHITIRHDQPGGMYGSSRFAGYGKPILRPHTTTEAAILRAHELASQEARRDMHLARRRTKIGGLISW
ncbi:hypothetical protein H9P43_001886 [Blastocladiella emersonii ATCC 22665]|nr:hypothetical protein H9P43_001886 [Blastocladiella emersonii ATCC 22665]